jgi:Chaperone of endosialidase
MARLSTTRGTTTRPSDIAQWNSNTGDNNTAIGQEALRAYDGNYNTAIGQNAMGFAIGTGNNNIALGNNAGKNLTAGDNNIFIGNFGLHRESNTIRIGTPRFQTATYVAGISGAIVPDGVAVIVGADGHLGTTISSARSKDSIKPMDKASEAIFALRPVTFRYKNELDPEGIPQFGLVAEDVEKVNPALVLRDKKGKAYSVRYDQVNAMLLNEFLKEHRKVQQLEATVVQQQKDFAVRLEEQAAQIQKVSAELETMRRAQRTLVSNP